MFSLIALLSFINGYPTITWVSVVVEMLIWYYVYNNMTSKTKYYVIDNVRYFVKERGDTYDA